MTNLSKVVVFFGTDDFSVVTLQDLVQSGYNVAAIVTKPDSKSGRGQQLEQSAVKKFAVEKNIKVWQPMQASEINENIAKLGDDTVGVLVSYGKIIPKSTIDLFPNGIINIHPSLLPKYRGPSPIESAIEKGDAQTGISIMKLTSEMDAGPIYGYMIHELEMDETRLDLRDNLAYEASIILLELLPGIIDSSIQPSPQDDSRASYCKLLSKKDAYLMPDRMTAVQAERLVRAHLGFPKTKIDVLGHNIVITKSHVSDESKTPLDIKFKDGSYLSVDELIAPSGRIMTAREFLNGYS